MNWLRILVELYYDFQKGRIAYFNRLNLLPKEVREEIEDRITYVGDNLKKMEKEIEKEIKREIQNYPLYTEILRRIKGIGPILAADLIAWTCTERDFLMAKNHPFLQSIKQLPYAKIEKFNDKMVRVRLPPVLTVAKYPSDFYKYCGLIPGCRRKRGEQVNYNPKLKTLFWKIVMQILRVGKSHYVYLYKTWKAEYLKKYEQRKDVKAPRALAHYTAIKKVSRHLALTVYLAYKYFNNEPAYLPYPVSILGHSIEPPFVDGLKGPEYLNFLVEYALQFDKREVKRPA